MVAFSLFIFLRRHCHPAPLLTSERSVDDKGLDSILTEKRIGSSVGRILRRFLLAASVVGNWSFTGHIPDAIRLPVIEF